MTQQKKTTGAHLPTHLMESPQRTMNRLVLAGLVLLALNVIGGISLILGLLLVEAHAR